jgi:hypothetical protein
MGLNQGAVSNHFDFTRLFSCTNVRTTNMTFLMTYLGYLEHRDREGHFSSRLPLAEKISLDQQLGRRILSDPAAKPIVLPIH